MGARDFDAEWAIREKAHEDDKAMAPCPDCGCLLCACFAEVANARERREAMSGKWKLTWGIHRGTLMSRDTGDPKGCDSLEDCKAEANMLAESFRDQGFGYIMWFATAHGPDGERVNLEEHQHYYAR